MFFRDSFTLVFTVFSPLSRSYKAEALGRSGGKMSGLRPLRGPLCSAENRSVIRLVNLENRDIILPGSVETAENTSPADTGEFFPATRSAVAAIGVPCLFMDKKELKPTAVAVARGDKDCRVFLVNDEMLEFQPFKVDFNHDNHPPLLVLNTVFEFKSPAAPEILFPTCHGRLNKMEDMPGITCPIILMIVTIETEAGLLSPGVNAAEVAAG
jgi:hypothetical protein